MDKEKLVKLGSEIAQLKPSEYGTVFMVRRVDSPAHWDILVESSMASFVKDYRDNLIQFTTQIQPLIKEANSSVPIGRVFLVEPNNPIWKDVSSQQNDMATYTTFYNTDIGGVEIEEGYIFHEDIKNLDKTAEGLA